MGRSCHLINRDENWLMKMVDDGWAMDIMEFFCQGSYGDG